MSASYHINNSEGLITITGTAQVRLSGAYEVAQQLFEDPAYDPNLPQLIDLRQSSLDIDKSTEEKFRDFILHGYRPLVNSSIAIVVDEKIERQTLARWYHLSSRMDKTELFDQYHQALKWLMHHEFANGSG